MAVWGNLLNTGGEIKIRCQPCIVSRHATKTKMLCVGVVHVGIGLLDDGLGQGTWLGVPIMVLVGATLVSLVIM